MILCVDKEKCISCLSCVASFPANFQIGEDGKSEYVTGSEISNQDAASAITSCPVEAISEAS